MNNINFNIFIFLLIILIFTSCKESIDGVVDFPYSEQIVIRASLEAGKPIKGISITKTLATMDTFNISSAYIDNVDAQIITDNKIYKLKALGNSLFETDSLIAESGKNYTLEVNWNGKKAFASSSVPFPFEIDSIQKLSPSKNKRSNDWNIRYSGMVKLNNENIIVGGYRYDDSLGINPFFKNYTARAYRNIDTNSNGKVKLILFSKNVIDTNNIQLDTLSYQLSLFIETYDKQFYEYYRTRSSGDSPNSTFGLSGTNIHWNVKGDGVGLFIGFATTRKRFSGIK